MLVIVAPVKEATPTVVDFSAVTVLPLFANCQPANSPVPKIRASANTSSKSAPALPDRLRGEGNGCACFMGSLGGGNEPCSKGIGVSGGVSSISTSTSADERCGGKNGYDSEYG